MGAGGVERHRQAGAHEVGHTGEGDDAHRSLRLTIEHLTPILGRQLRRAKVVHKDVRLRIAALAHLGALSRDPAR